MLNDFVFPELFNYFNNQYWEEMFQGLWWVQDAGAWQRDRDWGVSCGRDQLLLNLRIGVRGQSKSKVIIQYSTR